MEANEKQECSSGQNPEYNYYYLAFLFCILHYAIKLNIVCYGCLHVGMKT